ncbi:unnamed protein product [Ixodes persulcatus]
MLSCVRLECTDGCALDCSKTVIHLNCFCCENYSTRNDYISDPRGSSRKKKEENSLLRGQNYLVFFLCLVVDSCPPRFHLVRNFKSFREGFRFSSFVLMGCKLHWSS